MKELDVLRAWLLSQRGEWTRIARETGMSPKTISRIANLPEYKVTLQTFTTLESQRKHAMSAESSTA